jgi:hypothetical protein
MWKGDAKVLTVTVTVERNTRLQMLQIEDGDIIRMQADADGDAFCKLTRVVLNWFDMSSISANCCYLVRMWGVLCRKLAIEQEFSLHLSSYLLAFLSFLSFLIGEKLDQLHS